MSNQPDIRVCDLFACGGGLSCGLEMVDGIKVMVANEYDKYACATFKENHKECQLIEGDVTDEKIKEEIIKKCKEKQINVIVGGIPCVAFSQAGKRDPFDNRGQLYKDYFEIVSKINPDVCLIENVKGLLSMKHLDVNNLNEKQIKNMMNDYKNLSKKNFEKKYNQNFFYVKDKWIELFKKLGYNTEYKLLKASNYGVPQHRERVIIIASKLKNNEIIFPEETHNEEGNNGKQKWKTVKEAIDDLKNKEDKKFSHEFRTYKDQKTIELLNTQNLETSYSGYGESNYKCHPDKPSLTVKENHGAVFVHYELPRHMTARELARLQSFPDTFIFKCNKGQSYKQIGNAVPPLLGKALGNSIKKMFKN